MANISDTNGTMTFRFQKNNLLNVKTLIEIIMESLTPVYYNTTILADDILVEQKDYEIDLNKLTDIIEYEESSDKAEVTFAFYGQGRWIFEANMENFINWTFYNHPYKNLGTNIVSQEDKNEHEKKKENFEQKIENFFENNRNNEIEIFVSYDDIEIGQKIHYEAEYTIIIRDSIDKCVCEKTSMTTLPFNRDEYGGDDNV